MNSSLRLGVQILTGLLILLGAGLLFVGVFFLWASSSRYSEEDYARLETSDEYPLKTTTNEITVLSFNIGYLSGLTNNQAVNRTQDLYDDNLDTVIKALKPLNPDILALQEIDFDSRRSFRVDQVKALNTVFEYPQQAIAINWDKRYVPFPSWSPTAHFGEILSGQAILSRFPITRHERFVLEKVATNPFYFNALYLDRLAQVADVQIGDQTLIVINLHLEAFDRPTRQNQTEFVLALAEQYAEQHPVLLVGDFNSALNRDDEGEPRSIQTVLESSTFTPAVSAESWTQSEQFTFPSDSPQYKLDYIFYTPDSIELVDVDIPQTTAQASDHLPVLMRLRLR
ncbi:endonuclease/exonuclease/phosphatase family protein [Oscillatoria sp. CS-180]|uniref:endonuclease/exonuclease/phosphatase family protein n=1 Tax=Oscillatoria sp. CS-180 TaxID=3021720 RepID=UPI00232F74E3|nr:endonuclease/exonuclease/phosphatase family protein [Oscillatoria sp. CS-180]MDB9527700.1 endonuclease/exonuclease/phosphatase family protein [Oscillatoria sp. CS-180]